jgi:predicted Zn-dependent protease
MLQAHANYAASKSAVLIGITTQDMYTLGQDWTFCFGWRRIEQRVAIVSTARMDLHYPEEPRGQATLSRRLRKVITKDIGILYYGKPPSSDPKSVLYDRILGLEELDRVSDDF